VEASVAGLSAGDLAGALRSGDPAVVPRIEGDRVLFDTRTVADREIPEIARLLEAIARR
jgi:seryl-tRNA(Sec) selenium transferase